MLGSPLPCPCKTPPPVWHPALSHPPIRPLISLRPSTFASSPPVSLKASPSLQGNGTQRKLRRTRRAVIWFYKGENFRDDPSLIVKLRILFYFFHRRNVHSTCEYCTAWKSRGQIKAKRTWDEAQSCGFSRCCNKCLLSFHLSCLKLLHFFFFKLWMKTALGQNALRKWLVYEEDFCT